jgi:hypothetical protein
MCVHARISDSSSSPERDKSLMAFGQMRIKSYWISISKNFSRSSSLPSSFGKRRETEAKEEEWKFSIFDPIMKT